MKNILSYLLILHAIVFVSCRVPQELNPEKKLTTPAAFSVDSIKQGKDSMLSWRQYFKDPYLVGLIDTALRINPDLQIANQRVYAATAQYKANRNMLLPQFNASLSTGVNRFGDYTMDGVGNFDTNRSGNITEDQRIPNPVPDYYVGLSTSWEIGVTGKLQNRKRAQLNRYLASEESRKYFTTQLVAEIARMYYELLALDAELDIIKRNIALQEKGLEVVNIQKQSGRINELAVKQFQAQLYNAQALEADIKQQIIAAENALNSMIGRYPQVIARKDTLDVADIPPMLYTGVPSDLLRNRTDVRAAELEYIASRQELKSAKAAFYPSIQLTAAGGLNAFTTAYWIDPVSLAYGVVGNLTAPIFNRAQIMNQYRQSYAAKNESFLMYQKTVIKGVEEVTTGLNQMRNYAYISELKANEVRTMRQAVAISNELFVTGFANYMEVLLSRQNRLNSELQYTEALKKQFLASIYLYKALGGGWK